jgi:hypothetical protein
MIYSDAPTETYNSERSTETLVAKLTMDTKVRSLNLVAWRSRSADSEA